MTTGVVLAVSPHLDDAAFSFGASLSSLARTDRRVVVATVFTASVPSPTGFALACQLDKGLGPEVDYMALRRAEDAAAQRILGAEPRHLGLREAPHRGYESAPALFGPVADADRETPGEIATALEGATGDLEITAVLAPQALGDHVDHRLVREAVEEWAGIRQFPLGLWRDTPYVMRDGIPGRPGERGLVLDEESLQAKEDACTCYASQLGFQFGGEPGMRAAVRTLALDEGRRLGLPATEAFAQPVATVENIVSLAQTVKPSPV
ncbi:LmbE family N-acetylglucosaminyl deacetylase [Motilibacter rhizosphaerae]|uniref:LmbE family N-acetylglucosaminyl deacetylase n=1 Tax=Motilibacter rhizosphaerae TaxID=598652 RepID=A0A4Q7NUC5_9ACTN|nr:PIG-L family deacetylase [Motilibacter rhizosphaerae]RZS90783.1 LmbE family N-acetylglucosaminyl deacetylase [Motilibacter rhizosphaerae]